MNKEEFIEKSEAFRKRESVLDGSCIHEKRTGMFGRHMMEKSGLLRYAGSKGKTRIVIEYDGDSGEGFMRAVNECLE